jgi:hypothetical protein
MDGRDATLRPPPGLLGGSGPTCNPPCCLPGPSPHPKPLAPSHPTPPPQGEEGNAFYIVESGQLAAYKDGGPTPVLAYGPGDYFGELALIRDDARRAATVGCRLGRRAATVGAGAPRMKRPWQPLGSPLRAWAAAGAGPAFSLKNHPRGAPHWDNPPASDMPPPGPCVRRGDAAGARARRLPPPAGPAGAAAAGRGGAVQGLRRLGLAPRTGAPGGPGAGAVLGGAALGDAARRSCCKPYFTPHPQKQAGWKPCPACQTHPPLCRATQDVHLSDLQSLAVLGAGGFGRVTLVRQKAASASGASPASVGGGYYALKQMAKAYIKAQGLVRHVHREKQVRRAVWTAVERADGAI